MEPLWSPVVAAGRNRWQVGASPERLRKAKIVAVGCDQRRPKSMVRRGRRFESVRGLCKSAGNGAFSLVRPCRFSSVRWVWSPL